MLNNITGIWKNELNSTVRFFHDKDGSLSGEYNSYVGKACGGVVSYDLTGRTNLQDQSIENQGAVAWSVAWSNEQCGDSKSASAWSGQYQVIDGVEKISTTWLLTSETDPSDNWSSTRVGQDEFHRMPGEVENSYEDLA